MNPVGFNLGMATILAIAAPFLSAFRLSFALICRLIVIVNLFERLDPIAVVEAAIKMPDNPCCPIMLDLV